MIGPTKMYKIWSTPAVMEVLTGVVLCLLFAMLASGTGAVTSGDLLLPGTSVTVQLAEPLSSRTARLGEAFEARVVSSEAAKGFPVIPVGARAMGRCVATHTASEDGRPGYLRLTLTGLWDAHGHFLPLETTTISQSGNQMRESARSARDAQASVVSETARGPQSASGSTQPEREAVVDNQTNLTFVLLDSVSVPSVR